MEPQVSPAHPTVQTSRVPGGDTFSRVQILARMSVVGTAISQPFLLFRAVREGISNTCGHFGPDEMLSRPAMPVGGGFGLVGSGFDSIPAQTPSLDEKTLRRSPARLDY